MSSLHEPIAAEQLFATHQKRIELVRQCANESTEAEFARKWLSVLRRCAVWFSSMPLSPDLHCEPGGAFRATIESTFYAMRLAGGQKFAADLTSDKRRRLEPQYNFAVFLATACSLLDEPFRHFEFVRQSDQEKWNPAAHGAFGAWVGTGSYAVLRRATPLKNERMRSAMLGQTVITLDLLAGLDMVVHSDLFNAINPERSPQGFEALVHKVVRQAMDVAVDFERKAQRAVFAPVKFDVPSAVHVALALEPQIVSAEAPPASPQAFTSTPQAAASTQQGATTTRQAAASPQGPDTTAAAGAGTQNSGVDVSSSDTQPVPTAAPQLSQPLRDALAAAAAQPASANMAPQRPAAVDPAAAGGQSRRSASASGPTDEDLNQVLGPGAAMLKEFFKALAGDVTSGKAKVVWEEKGLAVQKRLVGAYGMTSDTLVEQLKKRSLLLRAHGNDICIVEQAGKLIWERPAS
ncbi:TraI domain-containing protein [Caballeronia sp. EK]|uniref:TraI domain-containing protein n=1 Tax=Caballeronia TaxID=1827195 RepID=UPI0016550A27|nr:MULTISPECIES: TraI domain-containing protein [Caballeronia]MBC8640782.1 TraI domain-containing protein [Caballeronia sp. EK]GJH14825.1 TraI domain-containing protein [Caballeronia novacaledonica]